MRKSILILSMILIAKMLHGQQFEISIGPTFNNLFHSPAIIGFPNYNSKIGFCTGFTFTSSTENRFTFKYGINYQCAKIEIDPFIDPRFNPPPYDASINLFSLGASANLNLRHLFYIDLGPTIDLSFKNNPEESIDNQTGIGVALRFGKKFKLNDNLSFSISPNVWIHNLIPIKEKDSPSKLVVAGLNGGITFGRFKIRAKA